MAKDPRTTTAVAEMTVNEMLLDRGIRHAIYLERLKTHEVHVLIGRLNRDLFPELVAQLEKQLRVLAQRQTPIAFTDPQLVAVQTTASQMVADGMQPIYALLTEDLAEIAQAEAEHHVKLLDEGLTGLVTVHTPASAALASTVNNTPMNGLMPDEWFKSVTTSAQRDLIREMNVGLAQGDTLGKIIRRIDTSITNVFVDTVTGKIRRNLEAVSRTAINHACTVAREETYKANSTVVKGVRFVATLDSRTTEVCMSLDGKVYPVGEGPRPPMHYQCRSTTVPVTKSWRELGIRAKDLPPGTRSSLDGQVPAAMTYPRWLKNQPREVQDMALGPKRAALWRSGRVTIDRFVNDRGRKLSLKQLRAREGLTNLN